MNTGTPFLQLIRLRDLVRGQLRYLHYSLNTTANYHHWIRFIACSNAAHSGCKCHLRQWHGAGLMH
jgi:hypothetical protein